jgi:hypothetical protein
MMDLHEGGFGQFGVGEEANRRRAMRENFGSSP